MFAGRIGRLNFLLLSIASYAVTVVAYLIAAAIGLGSTGEAGAGVAALLMIAGGLAGFVITLSAWIRRLHDMEQSGWLALLSFIPLVNVLLFFVLLFAPGTPGPNKHGARPGTPMAQEPAAPYGPPPQQAYAPPPRQAYAPPPQSHTPPPPGPPLAERPFGILAQGLDRDFRANGSPEWVQLGDITGSEFARRASELGPPGPGDNVPNVAFDRDGVRLVLYQEDATVWHATDQPPGMTDRVAVHDIPQWLEAGVTYAKRA